MIFRKLNENECNRIIEINPEQYIENAWRLVEGKRTLVKIDYLEKGWPDGFARYRDELKNIILTDGSAFGAFDDNDKLIGFAAIKNDIFGKTSKHILLDSMFVSTESRGKGIGKKLLHLCSQQGNEWGAEKIYICAGSAEDTIAFYKSVGCVEAKEINQELYEQDMRDVQLEYVIINN